MTNILSTLLHSFKEIGSYIFATSKLDEFRKAEAMRVAYGAALWPRG